jgi:hypothetical protein
MPKNGFEALIDERPIEQIISQIEENEKKLKQIQGSKIFPLQCCEHVFHGKCLREYFKTQIENSKFPLICPEP